MAARSGREDENGIIDSCAAPFSQQNQSLEGERLPLGRVAFLIHGVPAPGKVSDFLLLKPAGFRRRRAKEEAGRR
jgi:hypothetical protein